MLVYYLGKLGRAQKYWPFLSRKAIAPWTVSKMILCLHFLASFITSSILVFHLSDFVALHFAIRSHDVIHLEASDTTSNAIGRFHINAINVPDHRNIFDL